MPLSLANQLPPPLRRLLEPLLSQEPAAQLIRSTARQQWKLLAVLLQALQNLGRFANTVSVS